MKSVSHDIEHVYQPTNISCGQSAVSMLLSAYDVRVDVRDVMQDIPMLKDDEGKEWGTFGVDLARFCMRQGFAATYVSFDCLLIDQKWAGLSQKVLAKKVAAMRKSLPAIGKNLTTSFLRSYGHFLKEKGELLIEPCLTSALVYDRLRKGPLIALVTFGAMYGRGTGTHFVVVYGNDAKGNFLVADSWEKPGRHVVEPERLIAAVMAGQMTCENGVFWIWKK